VGQLFVILDRYDPERTPGLLDSLRADLARYPAARLELREFENGPPIDAPIALRVRGPDLDTLRQLAARVEDVLEATPGTQFVDNPVRLHRTDLRVTIDRAKAGLLGIPTLEIDRTLRLGLAGLETGVLRESNGDARDIVVRLADRPRPTQGPSTGCTWPRSRAGSPRSARWPTSGSKPACPRSAGWTASARSR
jgi:multidrug efflux pump subunit AcrB